MSRPIETINRSLKAAKAERDKWDKRVSQLESERKDALEALNNEEI